MLATMKGRCIQSWCSIHRSRKTSCRRALEEIKGPPEFVWLGYFCHQSATLTHSVSIHSHLSSVNRKQNEQSENLEWEMPGESAYGNQKRCSRPSMSPNVYANPATFRRGITRFLVYHYRMRISYLTVCFKSKARPVFWGRPMNSVHTFSIILTFNLRFRRQLRHNAQNLRIHEEKHHFGEISHAPSSITFYVYLHFKIIWHSKIAPKTLS